VAVWVAGGAGLAGHGEPEVTPRQVLAAAACALAVLGSVRAAPAQSPLVTIDVRDVPLVDVVRLIATQARLSVICDGTVSQARVTFRMQNVTARTVLDALEQTYGLQEIVHDHVVRLVLASTAATSLDEAANVHTLTIATAGTNAQALAGPVQQAVPSAVVVAAPSGRALVVSGSPAAVKRAREVVAALTAESGASEPSSRTLALRYLTAADAVRLLTASGYASSPTTIVADEPRSELVVRGSDEAVARIESALALIDQPAPQVTFDVQVLDVENDGSSNTGILFGGLDAAGKPAVGSGFLSFANRSLPITATLNALVASGSARVLADPYVAVTNGETGKILIGSQYPIQTSTGGLASSSQVQFLQIGVQLQIRPSIGADGSILTDLVTTYSQITGLEPVTQYPIVGTRTVESRFRVQDGEPILLAGLYSEVTSETVRAVPGLMNVPLFGGIFRNRVKSATKDEIVFAIHPHIGLRPAQGGGRASH
jgi:type II secretory pathway component GspD/PulD (secretin)